MKKFKCIKAPETVTLVLFSALLLFITSFHEPWFDEAQSWQLAKGCSLRELLFIVPHYEGHPSLWWLILAIPAKAGVSFEIGLKSVGLIFSFAAVFLLEYKTSLPRWMKLLLPFTYFFFYQYGVIVRPYCVMLFAGILVAVTYEEKTIHPWKFALALLLLCLTGAYGLMAAGGIAFAWLIDILTEKGIKKSLREVFSDHRTASLIFLLFCALLIIAQIFPVSGTYSAADNATNPRWLCLLCSCFTSLSDIFLTTSPWFSADNFLQTASIEAAFLIPMLLINLLLMLFICVFSSVKSVKYMFLPYFFVTVFSGLVYFQAHHIGSIFIIVLFWLCISCEDSNKWEIGKKILCKIERTEKDTFLAKGCVIAVSICCILIPIYWSVISSAKEIQYQYSYGRKLARFIKENKLDELYVATQWAKDDIYADVEAEDMYEKMNTVLTGIPTPVLAYFDNNFVYNFNDGDPDKGYTTHKKPDAEVNKENLQKWRSSGVIPEVLLGEACPNLLTNGAVTMDNYAAVYNFQVNYIWKGNVTSSSFYLYLLRDLLDQRNLDEIEVEQLSITITDEMKQEYENGKDINEILDPYLDELFGKN